MDVRDLTGRTALVTGAASGIGRATARALAERGADLVLCDVDVDGLERIAAELRGLGREVLARRVDVARSKELAELAAAVHERVEALDLLVNNAGVALGGGFLDTTLDDWNWILDINLRGVVAGCHYFVPAMVRRGRGGHVVNISSAAGFTPTDTLSAYCTTKFGVLGFSESLHEELRRHGIGVTAVCPGFIDTPIATRARMRGDAAAPQVRERMVAALRKRGYPPEYAARAILRAIQRGRPVAPITPDARALYLLRRLSPALTRRLARWLTARSRRQLGMPD